MLIPSRSTFTLAISCLTTSNLIHGPNIPGSYAILLFTASDLASTTSPIHNWALFLLWLHPFILFGVISPLISSSILSTYRPGEFLFQYPIILPSHTVHGVLKARILKWFAIPFSSGPYPVRPLHHDPTILGGPTRHGLVSVSWTSCCPVIRLASFLWLQFYCVCPLMPSHNTYHLTWVSLTSDVGYLSRLLQQSAAAAPYLGGGESSYCRPSWPWTWSSSSQPSRTPRSSHSCKLLQPLSKAEWSFLKKWQRTLPYDPATSLLCTYPENENRVICTPCVLYGVIQSSKGAETI